MNKKLLAAGLLLSGLLSQAQHLNCGNTHEDFSAEFGRRARFREIMKTKAANRIAAADGITYVAIKAHVFGDDDETGYTDSNDINMDMAYLNKFYKPLNVQFYFSGESFSYYPDTALNNWQDDGDADNFHAEHGVSNAINMYIARSVVLGGQYAGGWSYVAPSWQAYNMMWIVGGQMAIYDGKTTGHEMGHYFGLMHTFNDSTHEEESWRELVTRNFNEQWPRISANCEDAGDYVCDTESDPYGFDDATVENCVYTGQITDANGDLFRPNIPNLMDYYWCMQGGFTPGQYERMQWGKEIVTNGEDFSLDAPETQQPAPTNVVALNADTDYFGAVEVSWADNSQVETGYIIERATSANGDFTAIGGVAHNVASYTDVAVEKGLTYFYRVKASNTKSTYSGVSAGVLTPLICGNTSNMTCEQNNSPFEAAWYIDSFSLENGASSIQNIQSGCSTRGIGNFYNTYSAAINPGDVVVFNVKSKTSENDGAYNVKANLYADWNNDGDFDDKEELVYADTAMHFAETGGSFTVPQGILQGAYRLRVVMSVTDGIGGPCSVSYGEIEDYKLVYNNLSAKDFSKDGFAVYPNPAQSELNVKLPVGVLAEQFTIADVTGKIVVTQNGGDVLNVASLANGVYLLTVKTDSGVNTLKFIKN